MTDIEGKTYDIGPGSFVYAPPGIAGPHSWDVKEPLKLLGIRATTIRSGPSSSMSIP